MMTCIITIDHHHDAYDVDGAHCDDDGNHVDDHADDGDDSLSSLSHFHV